MKYEEMLKRAYDSLPQKIFTKERFEVPAIELIREGPKTIVKNFGKIIKKINRDQTHAVKFITKELATAATIDEERLILKGTFDYSKVAKAFEDYINKFVLCRECKRPDTIIIEQQGVRLIRCEACGAIFPLVE